jgi:hypothetical protein
LIFDEPAAFNNSYHLQAEHINNSLLNLQNSDNNTVLFNNLHGQSHEYALNDNSNNLAQPNTFQNTEFNDSTKLESP